MSCGPIGAFATVTVTSGDVPKFPAASHATAVSVALPSATLRESHVAAYGDDESLATCAPFTMKSTRDTPTLSAAAALIVTAPDTVSAVTGFVSVAVGAWRSGPGNPMRRSNGS